MASCTPPSINPQERPVPPGETLPVVETFHSLQGEGLHAGRSAFFLRLAGCRVGCAWCDTKHSWPEASHPQRSLAALSAEARAAAADGAGFAVVTGGEPLHHRLDGLCRELRAGTRTPALPQGLPLHLETSGVDPLSGGFDWITVSPKRHRPPTAELLAACQELKVVVEGEADLAFAEAMAGRALALRSQAEGSRGARAAATAAVTDPHSNHQRRPAPPALLLQPAWGNPGAQELAIRFVRHNPAWRLSLQSHKWLGVR